MAHWSDQKEKGGGLRLMRLVFRLYKLLGIKKVKIIIHFIVIFFYLFSKSSRLTSKTFLLKVKKHKGESEVVRAREVYRHLFSFSHSLVEKLSAWAGDKNSGDLIKATPDITPFNERLNQGKGAAVICSHLGNVEILRAFASIEKGATLPDVRINSIVDFNGTSQFNALIKEVNNSSMLHLVDASEINPAVIIELQDRINAGDLVIIAGDRTAASNRKKTTIAPFLGEDAYFPQGSFILATLLEAPIYYMFGVRQDDLNYNSPYELHVYKSKFESEFSKRMRKQRISDLTHEYAAHLESLCLKHPYQWYNFFNFWENPDKTQNTDKGTSN
ncbi:MAG: hypothetical protein OCD01_17670 [Fibrobacterales bacterium]